MDTTKWVESFKAFARPQVITMLFLGLSAGIPILLIFSTLGLWLNEAGVDKSTITYFSWAALGYSFKFVWAPLVDRLAIPILSKTIGRRRSWIILSQFFIMLSIIMMSSVDPRSDIDSLSFLALATVLLAFSSATQDIVIDAYRIESAEKSLQPLLSATYIAGYRIGMIIAGAGSLLLAAKLGSTKEFYDYSAWSWTYKIMAAIFLGCMGVTLLIREPQSIKNQDKEYKTEDYLRFFAMFLLIVTAFISFLYFSSEDAKKFKDELSTILSNKNLASFLVESLRLSTAVFLSWLCAKIIIYFEVINSSMLNETYINPVKDFFKRYGLKSSILLLSIVGLYRISDIVLGVITNVFYQDMGYTKSQIATITKTFGLFMTIGGGFLGGLLATRYKVFPILFVGALLSSLTNLLFMYLASCTSPSEGLLYFIISFDNLAGGLAGAAFVAFLSSLTNISFTAVQYAIFSSLMTLIPKILGGYSGTLVDSYGYENFFLFTTIIGIPILFLVWRAKKFI